MSDASSRVSFFAKNPTQCPVCDSTFYREELLTGRGRLIAGNLKEDLRRIYEPSKKFGEVHPLIYPVAVCPNCFYAAFHSDFETLTDEARIKIREDEEHRKESIRGIFHNLDFSKPRELPEGVASYYFAIMCYDYFPKTASPVIKQGISAIRTAWLFSDLHEKFPVENYDYLSKLFYRKASFFYPLAVEYEGNGKQAIANAGHLGPDLDKNYGYDGVLYLAAYLEYLHGPAEDRDKRIEALKRAKTTVARIFGMGKASKDKPAAILEKSKELYSKISEEVKSGNPEDGEE